MSSRNLLFLEKKNWGIILHGNHLINFWYGMIAGILGVIYEDYILEVSYFIL
jgi:hypothetical protein